MVISKSRTSQQANLRARWCIWRKCRPARLAANPR